MSHVNILTQREKDDAFHPTVKAKNKEELAYDDDQELKETKEDIKHSDVMLGEISKEGY